MAVQLNICISDVPALRWAQIMELVLSHCAQLLWPANTDKRDKVSEWVGSLREILHQSGCQTSGQTGGSPKRGVTEQPCLRAPNVPLTSPEDVAAVPGSTCKHSAENSRANHTIPSPSEGNTEGIILPDPSTACAFHNSAAIEGSHPRAACAREELPGRCFSVCTSGPSSQCEPVMMEWDDRDAEHLARIRKEVPVHVVRLSGGITNELFHVYDPEDISTSVVVRVFGKETERVISRESELFYQSLFINTYAYGLNFLVYEFLDQYDPLPYTEMATEAQAIASAMAEFQVKATLAARQDYAGPLLADPSYEEQWAGVYKALGERSNADSSVPVGKKSRFERESNYTVYSLTKWAAQVASDELLSNVDAGKVQAFTSLVHKMQHENEWMMSVLEAHRDQLGEGVCHNDLLSANILRHRGTGELKIIDFDYTKRDFLLFDIANHLNEYTGLECDYARYFPDDSHIQEFIFVYRESMRRHLTEMHARLRHDHVSMDEIIPNERQLFWCADGKDEARVVAEWTQLVKLLTLASHLAWGTWSLVQEAVSVLDMDYLDYANLRLSRYFETKREFGPS